MTREQRRSLLGDAVIAQIHERVAQAPAPGSEVIDELRPILARPAGRAVRAVSRPAAEAA
jgi:hypothetical protein